MSFFFKQAVPYPLPSAEAGGCVMIPTHEPGCCTSRNTAYAQLLLPPNPTSIIFSHLAKLLGQVLKLV
jgi:hypothetical protein